jgi:hypothetical protein
MEGFQCIGKCKYIWLGISLCCGCQCVPVLSSFIRRWVSVHVCGVAQCCVAMCCLRVQLVPSLNWLSALVILLIGSLCLLCEAGPSLYCGCSLQGTCTVDWSYIAYCQSSTLSLMCYLLYVRTALFLLCGCVFCTAEYCHCMSDPSLLEKGLRCSWVGVGHCPSGGWSRYS